MSVYFFVALSAKAASWRTIDAEMEANGPYGLRMEMILGIICGRSSFASTAPVADARQMPQLIEQYTADRMSLNRIYPVTLRLRAWRGLRSSMTMSWRCWQRWTSTSCPRTTRSTICC